MSYGYYIHTWYEIVEILLGIYTLATKSLQYPYDIFDIFEIYEVSMSCNDIYSIYSIYQNFQDLLMKGLPMKLFTRFVRYP